LYRISASAWISRNANKHKCGSSSTVQTYLFAPRKISNIPIFVSNFVISMDITQCKQAQMWLIFNSSNILQTFLFAPRKIFNIPIAVSNFVISMDITQCERAQMWLIFNSSNIPVCATKNFQHSHSCIKFRHQHGYRAMRTSTIVSSSTVITFILAFGLSHVVQSCYSVIGDKPFLWSRPKFYPP